MKDGFYLSAYLNPAGLHRLVHVRLRHDNNVSLWEKRGSRVKLVRHWELERVSGQKMHRTPFLDRADEIGFLNRLLAPMGLTFGDMVEVWGTPDLATTDDYHLVRELPDIAFHSVAHLYSAVLMDSDVFFDGTIVGIAVDRRPDRLLDGRLKDVWFAGCVVREGAVDFFPVESPGSLYCEARDLFRRREGSLMALATATRAAGRCDREQIMAEHRFDQTDVVERSRAVLGGIVRQVRESYIADPAFTEEESLISAVMKEVQAVSVMIMERNVEGILERYRIDPTQAYLAVAGGYALNCPTNSHLMAKYHFRGFLAPPCVGDDGQAMGIGLAAFHKKLGGRFEFRYPGPYLGRADGDLDGTLREFAGFVAEVGEYDDEVAVDDLLEGPVAWFNGGSEIGPRALGNRSLLGDPTSVATKDALNTMKRREWWRPVAPVVLEDRLAEWFEDGRPSPYMLETFTIRPERRSRIPAVAHLDFSARIQSLNNEQNPLLHRLLTAFDRRTGVPMLCNTSLNDKGEPIIDTIGEALNFCLRRQVRVAYINGARVVLRNFADYDADGPLPRAHEPFSHIPADRAAARRRELNPHALPDLYLYLYLSDLELAARYDIREAAAAGEVRDIIAGRLAEHPGLRETAERGMHRNRVHFSAYGWQPLIPEQAIAYRDEGYTLPGEAVDAVSGSR
ncbi:MAG TPA: carbamoyltransferase C-terminal domain-containing protein [Streptosporangiaceae bacterium]|nr:carbamoyltransferase C-terminal domain-containing protein [Streptosporangiaceae bacterium]